MSRKASDCCIAFAIVGCALLLCCAPAAVSKTPLKGGDRVLWVTFLVTGPSLILLCTPLGVWLRLRAIDQENPGRASRRAARKHLWAYYKANAKFLTEM